tara:strand:+ start:1719 stop:3482 length:1764 start_codon:yes stop_codon:yes gene_type:complete
MLVLDCEVYQDYFLAAFMDDVGKVLNIELHDGVDLNKARLSALMTDNTVVTFNGASYDLYMVAAALDGWTTQKIKRLSDAIIKSNLSHWNVADVWKIGYPPEWDHVDIIDVLPGKSSLKIYGARIGMPKLQDLPIDPAASIDAAGRDILRRYCTNDLRVTKALLKTLAPQIQLRRSMSGQHGIDLRSKSDAQIAETVLKAEIEKMGKRLRPIQMDDATVRYSDPGIVSFDDPTMRNVFQKILGHRFELSGNGSIRMPPWLKDTKIQIGQGLYQMGIGGLHSTEKGQTVTATRHEVLCEFDVSSYYPNIILQQRSEPSNMAGRFLPVYQGIVERRVAAKRAGDKTTADSLKIVVNASFGKLGSKFSILYAPDLMIQTTITGQLCLLMLIERLEAVGVRVVSANTDGVVAHFNKALEGDVEQVVFDWMLDTSFELERTDYRSLHARDVNNYIAVKPGGSTKAKGVFAAPGLSKNPDFSIVSEAIASQLSGCKSAADVINECKDLLKFVTVRRVTGGAVWRGEKLGKAVRFYYSTDFGADQIEYATNSNKVPKSDGARPAMDIPDVFPDDVDKQRYIEIARKAMRGMGCV